MPAQVVSAAEWQSARAELLKEEKAATHLLSSISAKRRELPAVKISDAARFTFTASDGSRKTLLDLFAGRQQLILYHFMLYDEDKEGCVGCSFLMDHVPHLGHLNNSDTTFVAVAPAAIEKANEYKERMGWTFPFYSSKDTCKEVDEKGEEVTWKAGNGYFGIAVFIREGDDVFHTYSTTDRGTELMVGTYMMLDMTPLGRQEEKGNPMQKIKLHDLY